MPWSDPQFWIATLLVLGAVVWIGRGVVRVFRRPKRSKRATLTVEGKPKR